VEASGTSPRKVFADLTQLGIRPATVWHATVTECFGANSVRMSGSSNNHFDHIEDGSVQGTIAEANIPDFYTTTVASFHNALNGARIDGLWNPKTPAPRERLQQLRRKFSNNSSSLAEGII
jgi:hypothetical protein